MSMKKPIYQHIAIAIDARLRCQKRGNHEWAARWGERLNKLAKMLPSGSGIDTGTSIDTSTLAVNGAFSLHFGYHHMNDNGMYTHWSEHRIFVMPHMMHDIDIRILDLTEEDENSGLSEYLYEVYDHALRQEVEAEEFAEEVA